MLCYFCCSPSRLCSSTTLDPNHKHIEPNIFHISVRTHSLLRIQNCTYTHPIHILLWLGSPSPRLFAMIVSRKEMYGKCFQTDYFGAFCLFSLLEPSACCRLVFGAQIRLWLIPDFASSTLSPNFQINCKSYESFMIFWCAYDSFELASSFFITAIKRNWSK